MQTTIRITDGQHVALARIGVVTFRPSGRGHYGEEVPELQRVRADHAQAILAFELANRAYFAVSISDRGDDFYRQFTERHGALLAEQEAGVSAFYVLVDEGSVLGRFNLYDIKDASATLGYRVAERAANRGVATASVRQVCRLAGVQHGLRALTAATSGENFASQRVLTKAGFAPVGPADPTDLGGKHGTVYRLDLAAHVLGAPAGDAAVHLGVSEQPGPLALRRHPGGLALR